jgi:hypothetical protein
MREWRLAWAAFHIVEHTDVRPGELCVNCARPIEAIAGRRRAGAFIYHLGSPDLLCDDCTARHRPDLAAELGRTA